MFIEKDLNIVIFYAKAPLKNIFYKRKNFEQIDQNNLNITSAFHLLRTPHTLNIIFMHF